MMSLLESRMVLIVSIFYNLYILLAFIAQALLLFLMKKCDVRSLHHMRIYLYNSLALQFISTISAYLVQCRIVPNQETLAMLCYGPCKYLGSLTCQIIFHLLQTSLIASATSLIIAFYYRYEMLTTNSFTRSGHYKQIVISYAIPLLFLVFEVLSPSDLNKVGAELTLLHPTYDTSNYVLLGFSDVTSVIGSIQTCLMILGVYGTPFIALIFRRKIMKILNTTKSYHSEKIEQSKSMVLGLTIQTLLPLICYCPSFTYYIYAQYTHSNNQIAEFSISPFAFLFTIFDPLLTIYFVLPYRRSFKTMISKHSSTTAVAVLHSDTHTPRRNDAMRL